MRLAEDRVFRKQFAKLSQSLKIKVRERVHLLAADSSHPLLNDHKLGPPFEEYRSINVTGDYRLVYKKIGAEIYYLRAVGTHHQLYGS